MIKTTGRVQCPFCLGWFEASMGPMDTGVPSVVHSLPPCGEFNRLDAGKFLEAVNKVLLDN